MMNKQKSVLAFERACALFPGGVNSPVRAFKSVGGSPFVVSHGSGPYLFDIDDNRYIDYVLSWGPLVLGHAAPEVIEAINAQAILGTSFGACCELESELAELIISFFPSIQMMRFVNSGTEAGMSVLRLARGYTGRKKILKFSGCYHGHADSLLVKAGSGVTTLGLPDCAGVNPEVAEHTITAEFNEINELENVFSLHGNEIAAAIIEPVVGNAGLIVPNKDFLKTLRRLTSKYSSVLIFDEVMTGFRVSLGGAQKLYDIVPDITMLGKVIGGGLPVGAFGGKKEIMSQLAPIGPVYQAGTLSGNPLAMAAGLATLKKWSLPGNFDKASQQAEKLCSGLVNIERKIGIPFSSQSVGTMFGFFFRDGVVHNYTQAKESNLDNFRKFFQYCLNNGVYFAPSQFEAGFVSLQHTDDVIEKTLGVTEEGMRMLS
jgi:glutamate-1-semialdehyde 2,1-aminomutase